MAVEFRLCCGMLYFLHFNVIEMDHCLQLGALTHVGMYAKTQNVFIDSRVPKKNQVQSK